jgi:cell division protein FtsW (lipid II flippase)
MEIGFIGGTILLFIMGSMVFVGLHINKPFPWEKKDK